MPICLILAEDHQLVRQALRRLLESETGLAVLAEASDGLETVKLVEKLKPDVLMLDLMLPRIHGLEVIQRLHGQKTKIIVVTMFGEEPYLLEALKVGAAGYVLKDSPVPDLLKAIRTVASGEQYICENMRKFALNASIKKLTGAGSNEDPLTPRERLVLQFAADGLKNEEIANRLFISRRTVESHRASLMRKLGISSQTGLVKYAIRHNIVTA